MPEDLLVLGLGNPLCQDDGVGVVAVTRLLQDWSPGPGVRVMEGGTLGLWLLPLLESYRMVLLVDAIRGDGDPGTLVRIDGEEVALTALELRLLCLLYDRRGRVQSRPVLLDEVWRMSSDVNTRTVDTHVNRLREKLGDAGAYLETVRGVGYRFTGGPPDEAVGGAADKAPVKPSAR